MTPAGRARSAAPGRVRTAGQRLRFAAAVAAVTVAACGSGGGAATAPAAASDAPTGPPPAVESSAAPAPGPEAVSAPVAKRVVTPTRASTALALEATLTGVRLWSVHADGDTVAVVDGEDGRIAAEIAVGRGPRAVAVAADGRVWISVQSPPALVVVDPDALRVVARHPLPADTLPVGVVAADDGGVWVALSATGEVLGLDASGRIRARVPVGGDLRHLALTPDGTRMLVSRFVTPPLPGEATARVRTDGAVGGMLVVVDPDAARVDRTVVLRHADRADTSESGRGVPNYLGAAAVSPDGNVAWVPSKQDNVARGLLRDGRDLDFQSTVRAVSSRIDLRTLVEDTDRRIDHDNAGLASAAAWHPSGRWLFVALETSRQVAAIDAATRRERLRFETGLAPQALVVSPDGSRLFVQSALSRTVSAYPLAPLAAGADTPTPAVWTVRTQAVEPLDPVVLRGKQLFHDARDRRLARDAYLSCASCHADGGHDGRVWDFTGLGEGLRNTPSLRGRGGAPGRLHWTANFDEGQDFEGQIRRLAGGSGLMRDEDFAAGTRAQPLGDPKSGLSADLDALAAYLASLDRFDASPHRSADGAPSPRAAEGETLFASRGCAACHGGPAFVRSPDGRRYSIGTIRPSSGQRLGGPLDGLVAPALRDAWSTAPYLHDGSAPSVADAIRAHAGLAATDAEVEALSRYVLEMGAGGGAR